MTWCAGVAFVDSFFSVFYRCHKMIRTPRSVKRFADVFFDHDHELFVVGGAVRDALIGKPNNDFDFASSATPGEIRKLFRRVLPTGIQHGTVTVLFEGHHFEVTTYRVDGSYSDQRRPDSVSFTRSLTEDLSRRDFTINAIAFDPRSSSIVDPFEGREDLKKRVIRTVGCAEDRFSEDALRMIRAVRFATTLECTVLPEIIEAMRKNADLLARVAPERVSAELEKMMSAARPSVGWEIAYDTGLLSVIIPELMEDRSAPIPVFSHLLQTCDCAPAEDPVLRWAALLHDVGKPRCLDEDERGVHFRGHDQESAAIAEDILTRLRFSSKRIAAVTHLVRHHMFGYDSQWSDAAIRRFLARVGEDYVFSLTALRRADACGKSGRVPILPDMDELESRIRAILEQKAPLSRGDLAVDGKDLMRTLKMKPGPLIGIILDELMQTVLDDPRQNERETLLRIAKNYYRERLTP